MCVFVCCVNVYRIYLSVFRSVVEREREGEEMEEIEKNEGIVYTQNTMKVAGDKKV